MVRNANFYDDITLYTHDGNVLDNAYIENNLGQQYALAQNYHDALKHLQKSVAMQPLIMNLGASANLYELLNDKKKAREDIYKLLDIDVSDYTLKNFDFAAVNGSSLLLFYDTPAYAKDFITRALQTDPNSASLWANLAISEYVLRNKKAALADAQKARTLEPGEKTTNLYTLISEEKPIPSSVIFVRK